MVRSARATRRRNPQLWRPRDQEPFGQTPIGVARRDRVKWANTTIELGKALSGAAANSRFFWRLAALVGRSAYQCRKEFSSGAVDWFCDRQQPSVQPTGLSAPASFFIPAWRSDAPQSSHGRPPSAPTSGCSTRHGVRKSVESDRLIGDRRPWDSLEKMIGSPDLLRVTDLTHWYLPPASFLRVHSRDLKGHVLPVSDPEMTLAEASSRA